MAKMALVDNASTFSIIARAAAALSVLVIARFFYRLYQVRMLFREAAQKYGIVGLFLSRVRVSHPAEYTNWQRSQLFLIRSGLVTLK